MAIDDWMIIDPYVKKETHKPYLLVVLGPEDTAVQLHRAASGVRRAHSIC